MCSAWKIGRTLGASVLTLAIVIAVVGTVRAESSSPLIGKRVRLFVPSMGHKPISGQLTRIDQDSVFLRNYRLNHYEVTAVPKAEIDRCDVRAKGKPHTAIGVCLGLVAGVGAWIHHYRHEDHSHQVNDRHDPFWPVVFVGGGAVVGGALGGFIRPGVWREMPVDRLFQPRATDSTFKLGLTVTLRF